jgi:hypothetical protein
MTPVYTRVSLDGKSFGTLRLVRAKWNVMSEVTRMFVTTVRNIRADSNFPLGFRLINEEKATRPITADDGCKSQATNERSPRHSPNEENQVSAGNITTHRRRCHTM